MVQFQNNKHQQVQSIWLAFFSSFYSRINYNHKIQINKAIGLKDQYAEMKRFKWTYLLTSIAIYGVLLWKFIHYPETIKNNKINS